MQMWDVSFEKTGSSSFPGVLFFYYLEFGLWKPVRENSPYMLFLQSSLWTLWFGTAPVLTPLSHLKIEQSEVAYLDT